MWRHRSSHIIIDLGIWLRGKSAPESVFVVCMPLRRHIGMCVCPLVPEMCAICCHSRKSVQRRKIAGLPCSACFVGRSATSGQAVLKSMPPVVLKMALIGRPAGSRLQEFHTVHQNVQSESNTHAYICKPVYMYCIYIYIYVYISLCLTRLVAQQADTCEVVSSSGFHDRYAMDCLLC